MADEGGQTANPTPDDVANDETLNRWFESRYYDQGKLQSSVFRSMEISVFRESYRDWASVLAEFGDSNGMAQLSAGSARGIDGVEVRKDEPPPAHATIYRPDGKKLSRGQARRLRNASVIIKEPETLGK